MRKLLVVTLVVLSALTLSAQKTAVVSETMTVTGSVVQFAGATVAAIDESPNSVCSGVLETAQVRFTYDGTTPTSTVGTPLEIQQAVVIEGLGNITNFKAIRTGGTSGVIYWTCSK